MKNYRHTLMAFALCLLSTALPAQENDGYILEGKVLNDFDGHLYLFMENSKDSVKVTDGQFRFTGKVEFTTEASLRTKEGPTTRSIYLDNNRQFVEVNIQNNVTYVESLKGNKTQDILDDLTNFYETNGEREDFPKVFYQKLESVILANPKSQFTGELFSEVIMDPMFSFEESMSLYAKIDSTTQTRATREAIDTSLDKLKNTRIGTSLPEFSLPDQYGEEIRLSSFEGKMVLVEFWSSSCAPCRETNPQLVDIRQEFKSSGFDIFSISLDRNRDTWLRASAKDGIDWTSTIAQQGYKDPVIKMLKVQYLPSNYLLDKDGKILAINIKPEELRQKLNTLQE